MNWKNTLIATAIMLLTFALLIRSNNPEVILAKKPFSSFPTQIGDWKGYEERFDEQTYQVLGVDDSILANYYIPGKPWINLYVGFYESQREGKTIHSPKNCMPGGGWNIVDTAVVSLPLDNPTGSQQQVIAIVLQKGKSKQMALYWYQSQGRITYSEYRQRLYLAWDAVTRNRTDGAFVRLIAPVEGSQEQTLAMLKRFAQDLFPILKEYIPS